MSSPRKLVLQVSGPGEDTACTLCPAGKVGSQDRTTCDVCPAGKVSASAGLGVCTDCSAGTVSVTNGTTACTSCGAGSYAPTTGLASCFLCAAGKISAASGSASCAECSAGTVAASDGLSACLPCAAGAYSQNQALCTACQAGKISAVTGSASCAECSAGTVAASNGLSTCLPCAAGAFAQSPAGCLPCSAGKFSAMAGSGVCDDCPGDENSIEGSSKCDRCNAGFYYSAAGQCEAAPVGVDCGQGACTLELLQLSPGYWRIAADSPSVYACPFPDGCAGGYGDAARASGRKLNDDAFGDGYCAEGYTGTLCAVCADDFVFDEDSQACEATLTSGKCGVSTQALISIAVLALSVGGFVVIVSWYVRRLRSTALLPRSDSGEAVELHKSLREAKKVWKSAATRVKALVAFMQIVSSIGFNCDVTFPAVFEQILGALSIFNMDVVPALGLQCYFDSFDYIDKLTVVTVGPLAVASMLGVQFVLSLCSSDPAKRKKRVQLVSYLFLMLTFLVLVSTSTTLFHCKPH